MAQDTSPYKARVIEVDMSRNVTLFEVRVKTNGDQHHNKMFKMYHILARSGAQAGKKAEKHGRPISVRKADATMMYGNIEKLELNQAPYQDGSPYKDAIAMDEMIWQKRNKRINNQKKDKKGIDNQG